MGLFVLPQLLPLFESLDVELPITTKMIMWAAVFFRDHGLVFTPLFIMGCAALYFALRLKAVKPLIDRFLLKVPMIGQIQLHSSLSQFCATMSLLLQSGIPILDAIPSSAQAANNDAFRSAIMATIPQVRGGTTFAAALRLNPGLFPHMVIELIQIGETAGSLAQTLSYVAEFHEEEAEYAVKTFTTALEPMLLMVIGLIVGIFIASILVPIYDITANVA
jgi:type II secretory pathway component PulF